MIDQLSILIPTFNHNCTALVHELSRQLQKAHAPNYEIIVADDASTDRSVIAENRSINAIAHCRYIERSKNAGRAAIRNFLYTSATYDHMLFLDADVQPSDDRFILRYLSCNSNMGVVSGGVQLPSDESAHGRYVHQLRYIYEQSIQKSLHKRHNQCPYQSLSSANFMLSRKYVAQPPFDVQIQRYGYEDTLFGKRLMEQGIPMLCIDNPVIHFDNMSNEDYLNKVEEALHTLRTLKEELAGFSPLLALCHSIEKWHMAGTLRRMFRLMRENWRRNLCSSNPSLLVFKIYKTGYFLSITQDQPEESKQPDNYTSS
ncbi:MAG: glycosyltransferase family 2 protein [Prevotella sp.]